MVVAERTVFRVHFRVSFARGPNCCSLLGEFDDLSPFFVLRLLITVSLRTLALSDLVVEVTSLGAFFFLGSFLRFPLPLLPSSFYPT